MRTYFLPAAALALALTATPVDALTVDQGYAAIPHKRQPFDAKASTLPAAEVEALKKLFGRVDEGVVLRAETLRAHGSGNAAEIKRLLDRYDTLIAALEKEPTTEAVAPARDKLLVALRDQRKFFAARSVSPTKVTHLEFRQSAEMREASRNLAEAYRVLMKAFPGEGRQNKTAFQNYMSALDYY